LCRGVSLHKYLHSDSFSKPSIEWAIDIATQIAQGMGYLHNKQMVNKDLRSKNIFIDGCKAVISDFGLHSITKLCKKFK
jgi:kinase suppressor of Ras 2